MMVTISCVLPSISADLARITQGDRERLVRSRSFSFSWDAGLAEQFLTRGGRFMPHSGGTRRLLLNITGHQVRLGIVQFARRPPVRHAAGQPVFDKDLEVFGASAIVCLWSRACGGTLAIRRGNRHSAEVKCRAFWNSSSVIGGALGLAFWWICARLRATSHPPDSSSRPGLVVRESFPGGSCIASGNVNATIKPALRQAAKLFTCMLTPLFR